MNELKVIKQSQLVTFCPYKLSSWQINFVTNLVTDLQPYLGKDIDWLTVDRTYFSKVFKLNTNFEYEVEIPLSKIDRNRHGKKVIEEIRKLRTREIDYDIPLENGKNHHVNCLVISTINDYSDGKLTVGISIGALRWMLYYSKNVQLTPLDRKSVLAINGAYSKRIYQFLSHYYRERIKKVLIKDLMYYLQTPEYTVQDFERKILATAFNEINYNENSRLMFKYNLIWEDDGTYTGGKKGFNTVVFKIYDTENPKGFEEFKNDDFVDRIISKQKK